jgi:hypothetical protein
MLTRSRSNKNNEIKEIMYESITNVHSEEINEYTELIVDIDFDDASKEWNANKKKMKNCMYRYICMYCIATSDRKCGRIPLMGTDFCKTHSKK